MEISKKDLLKETGISYGQLYRWKREGLIPEEWFEKRSSFTGQETYFPKEAVLKRIEMIQQLKDHYSLEEMSNMLTPEVDDRLFNEDDMESFKEISVDIVSAFMDVLNKDEFSFTEILLMIAFRKCQEEIDCKDERFRELILHSSKMVKEIRHADMMLLLIQIEDQYYVVFQESDTYYFDDRFHIIKKIDMTELNNTIKLKYQHIFQFEHSR